MMIRHIFIAAMKEGVLEEIIREIAKKTSGAEGKIPNRIFASQFELEK